MAATPGPSGHYFAVSGRASLMSNTFSKQHGGRLGHCPRLELTGEGLARAMTGSLAPLWHLLHDRVRQGMLPTNRGIWTGGMTNWQTRLRTVSRYSVLVERMAFGVDGGALLVGLGCAVLSLCLVPSTH